MSDEPILDVDDGVVFEGGVTPGAVPPVLSDLVRADERVSFVYFERCVVNQAENAITITDDEGTPDSGCHAGRAYAGTWDEHLSQGHDNDRGERSERSLGGGTRREDVCVRSSAHAFQSPPDVPG